MSKKRVERAAEKKRARELRADTAQALQYLIATDDADWFNLSDRLVHERGVHAYLAMSLIAHEAITALAEELKVSPVAALKKISARPRRIYTFEA